MAKNEKGENWPQFLKEMQQLQPVLPTLTPGMGGGSAIPILGKPTRQAARAAGFSNVKEMQEHQQRRQDIEAYKQELINRWFDEHLARYLPKWYIKLAAPRPRLFNAIGIYITFKNGAHRQEGHLQDTPCTICRIHFKFFKWWELEAGRLIWE